MHTFICFLLLSCSAVSLVAADAIEVPGAVIKVVDDVAVPAAEAGVLSQIAVKEGQLVVEDELLAKILDSDVRLTVERTKLEADIAKRKFENGIALLFAAKSTEVSRAELKRSIEERVRNIAKHDDIARCFGFENNNHGFSQSRVGSASNCS